MSENPNSDKTLGELKSAFNTQEVHDTLRDAIEIDIGRYTTDLSIRFVFVEDLGLSDAPDDMLLRDFVKQPNMRIIIDEGNGGVPVGKPELV